MAKRKEKKKEKRQKENSRERKIMINEVTKKEKEVDRHIKKTK